MYNNMILLTALLLVNHIGSELASGKNGNKINCSNPNGDEYDKLLNNLILTNETEYDSIEKKLLITTFYGRAGVTIKKEKLFGCYYKIDETEKKGKIKIFKVFIYEGLYKIFLNLCTITFAKYRYIINQDNKENTLESSYSQICNIFKPILLLSLNMQINKNTDIQHLNMALKNALKFSHLVIIFRLYMISGDLSGNEYNKLLNKKIYTKLILKDNIEKYYREIIDDKIYLNTTNKLLYKLSEMESKQDFLKKAESKDISDWNGYENYTEYEKAVTDKPKTIFFDFDKKKIKKLIFEIFNTTKELNKNVHSEVIIDGAKSTFQVYIEKKEEFTVQNGDVSKFVKVK